MDEVIPPIAELIDSSSEPDDSPWITVQRRHARSLDSAKQNKNDKSIVHFNTKKLTTKQKETVQAAAASLTEEQMARVRCRQEIVHTHETEIQEEPESFRSKGKTIDPREWGNMGIHHEEMNPDMQAAILDVYEKETRVKKEPRRERSKRSKNRKLAKKLSDSGSDSDENFQVPQVSRHKSAASAGHAQVKDVRHSGSNLVAQIAPKSSLGVVLGKVALRHRNTSPPSEDPTSPSESQSDSEADDYSDNSQRSTRNQDLK